MKEIINKTISDLNNQFENIFLEGIKLKGFKFNNKIELEDFIKKRCRCEVDEHHKQRIYFIDDTPFLLHNYKTTFNIENIDESTISVDYGTYTYL